MLYIHTVIIGVEYYWQGRELRVRFSAADARLPVCIRAGGARLLAWGRRQGDSGRFPSGCCAPLDGIRAGDWDYWFPLPVKLPINRVQARDQAGHGIWSHPLVRGKYIQGLVARDGTQQRVYVVTFTSKESGSERARIVISSGSACRLSL